MPVEQQVMILYAVTNGLIDDVPVNKVRAFELGFLEYMRTQKPEIGEKVRGGAKLDDETTNALKAALNDFKQTFMAEHESARAAAAVPAADKSNTAAATAGNPLA
jgi:F-type H+-transporting ATPase subunit alpha